MKENVTHLHLYQRNGHLRVVFTIVLWTAVFLWTGCWEDNAVPDVGSDVRRDSSAANIASVGKDINSTAVL